MFFKKKLLVIVILLAFASNVAAQKNRIHSIVTILQKIDVSKGVDTAKFISVTKIIEETKLETKSLNTKPSHYYCLPIHNLK